MRTLAATLLLFLAIAVPAQAQLIVINETYRVVSVNPDKSVIKVAKMDGGKASDVIINGDTRMYVLERQIPNFTWRFLRKGMKITVHGGATWDFKVKAKKIYLL